MIDSYEKTATRRGWFMTTKNDAQTRAAFEAWAASIGLKLNGRYTQTLAVLCAEEAFKAGYQAALLKENGND